MRHVHAQIEVPLYNCRIGIDVYMVRYRRPVQNLRNSKDFGLKILGNFLKKKLWRKFQGKNFKNIISVQDLQKKVA